MQAKGSWNMEKDRQPKAEDEPKEEHKPHLSVKVKGSEGFAGSAWINPSKFNGGKYISVMLNVDVPAG
ncbi:MAG: hypothetical protein ABIG96_03105, partial [Candidatus Micrarchaeota archaeon]